MENYENKIMELLPGETPKEKFEKVQSLLRREVRGKNLTLLYTTRLETAKIITCDINRAEAIGILFDAMITVRNRKDEEFKNESESAEILTQSK